MGSKFNSTEKEFKKLSPGPGAYGGSQNVIKKQQPSFGFGTAKRPDYGARTRFVPGPGAYRLPAKLGNTVEYKMPN